MRKKYRVVPKPTELKMQIEQIVKLLELFSDAKKESPKETIAREQGLIKIVILQRGWIVVGRFYQNGSHCWIENGYVIRRWGTTKGLGELAINGKLSETILDPVPKVEFHQLTIVASILCDQEKWK